METVNTCPTEVADAKATKSKSATKPKSAESASRRTPEELAAERGIDLAGVLIKGPVFRYIRGRSRQIARQAGLCKADVDDVQQILFQRICENIGQFDPEEACFLVFVTALVERYAVNIIRHHLAVKRGRRVTCPLSTIVDDDGRPAELFELIGDREQDNRTLRKSPDPRTALDLPIDVREAITTLPDDMRKLVKLLMVYSPTDLARELGVPRTTIHDRIRQLRRHLQNTALPKYF
ncbi:MAG: hypothetical protein CMJ50_03840 [Planctomycetaceae bacterium]|nr:hypothetical protein [Planctomycetaceae bacterium]